MLINHERNLRSLERGSQLAAGVLRSITDVGVRMPDSEWTIGEAAAHLISSLETYGGWALGRAEPEQLGLLQKQANVEIARVNQSRLATVGYTDGQDLAERLLKAASSFLADAKDLPPETAFEWYDHVPMDVASITCVMLAEVFVHTYDIARTAGKPWHIDPADAEQMMLGALKLIPYYVDKVAARGVQASFEVRIRGGARVGIRLDDGVATIQTPPEGRYDCVISAEPVAFLLVGYGRIGLAKPLLTGKLLAFGRKPWLGLKFNTYFLKP